MSQVDYSTYTKVEVSGDFPLLRGRTGTLHVLQWLRAGPVADLAPERLPPVSTQDKIGPRQVPKWANG